jgi:hypothetical protein
MKLNQEKSSPAMEFQIATGVLIVGTIPTTLGLLTGLEELNIAANLLTGTGLFRLRNTAV